MAGGDLLGPVDHRVERVLGRGKHNYTATIDWGDGSASSAAITLEGSTLTVSGDHTYAEEGSFTVTTNVDHEGIPSSSTSTATVADAPLTAAAAVPPVSPQAFTGNSATFTDADPQGTATDYTGRGRTLRSCPAVHPTRSGKDAHASKRAPRKPWNGDSSVASRIAHLLPSISQR